MIEFSNASSQKDFQYPVHLSHNPELDYIFLHLNTIDMIF